MFDRGGDCEDTSILAAAILERLGYDVALLILKNENHAAIGINIDAYGSYYPYENRKYYYLETTGEGWEIGEFPDDLESSAHLYELKPVAMCIHDWTAEWSGRSKLDVTITATNVGSASAENIKLYAAFDAGDGYVWNPETSSFIDLNIGNSYTVTLTLDVPDNAYTRLIVQIIHSDGYAIDTSYSEWFDT